MNNHTKLYDNIQVLPKDIQKKICILCIKEFWKNYIPLTQKVPSWIHHSNQVKRELFEARIYNIHFSHLSFNTLPENKKWILGCQCNFCSTTKITSSEFNSQVRLELENPGDYVLQKLPRTWCSTWNSLYYYIGDTCIKVFDPLYTLL